MNNMPSASSPFPTSLLVSISRITEIMRRNKVNAANESRKAATTRSLPFLHLLHLYISPLFQSLRLRPLLHLPFTPFMIHQTSNNTCHCSSVGALRYDTRCCDMQSYTYGASVSFFPMTQRINKARHETHDLVLIKG